MADYDFKKRVEEIHRLDLLIPFLKEEHVRTGNELKDKEKEINNLKGSISSEMLGDGVLSHDGETYKCTIKKNPPKLVIHCKDGDVPDEYKKEKTTHVIMKNEIKKDLSDGKRINFAELEHGYRLEIKFKD